MKHSNRPLTLTILFLVLVVMLTSACGGNNGEQEKETYTVGILNIIPLLDLLIDGFKEGMTEKGYIEGENITYVYEGPNQLTAEQLLEAEVDLIFSTTTLDALGARELTDSVPIIFNLATDPVGIGLVESVAHPGGNVTGVMSVLVDTKRLELFTEMVPGIKRVLVPSEPERPQTVAIVEEIKPVAEALGLELVIVDTVSAEDVVALQQSLPDDLDAIFLLGSGGTNPARTAEWSVVATEHGLPLSSEYHLLTPDGEGPLMSYGTDPYSVGKQAVNIVDQILKGRDAGETPVETAESYLTVNLNTAEAIDIEVPDSLLSQATFIIRPTDE